MDDINRRFTYHAPTPADVEKYTRIRAEAKALARTLHELAPPGHEKGVAMRKLEETVMWANAAIARPGVPTEASQGPAAPVAPPPISAREAAARWVRYVQGLIDHAKDELASLPESRVTERMGWEGILAESENQLTTLNISTKLNSRSPK